MQSRASAAQTLMQARDLPAAATIRHARLLKAPTQQTVMEKAIDELLLGLELPAACKRRGCTPR
jgi:hypothetical protein